MTSPLSPPKGYTPIELSTWLSKFQSLSTKEKSLAVDQIVEFCMPHQVCQLMNLIEPEFRRDFISVLPTELAWSIFSYLGSKDLLSVSQTCSSLRTLANSNFLWKDVCLKEGITLESSPPQNRHPLSVPPWKAAFLRTKLIDMNWRRNKIRPAKVSNVSPGHYHVTCFMCNGSYIIVSAGDFNTLSVYSLGGEWLRNLVGHTNEVSCLKMYKSCYAVTGSGDQTLGVWNIETGVRLHTFVGHIGAVCCIDLDGNKVVSGSSDGTLRVWLIETGECLRLLVDHTSVVNSLRFKGNFVISSSSDGTVKTWDLATPVGDECIYTVEVPLSGAFTLIEFNGVNMVIANYSVIEIFDVQTGAGVAEVAGHAAFISQILIENDILLSASIDATVNMWNMTTGDLLHHLQSTHRSILNDFKILNNFMISSSDDGTVNLWDTKTGEFIRPLLNINGTVGQIQVTNTKLICYTTYEQLREPSKVTVLDFDVEW